MNSIKQILYALYLRMVHFKKVLRRPLPEQSSSTNSPHHIRFEHLHWNHIILDILLTHLQWHQSQVNRRISTSTWCCKWYLCYPILNKTRSSCTAALAAFKHELVPTSRPRSRTIFIYSIAFKFKSSTQRNLNENFFFTERRDCWHASSALVQPFSTAFVFRIQLKALVESSSISRPGTRLHFWINAYQSHQKFCSLIKTKCCTSGCDRQEALTTADTPYE